MALERGGHFIREVGLKKLFLNHDSFNQKGETEKGREVKPYLLFCVIMLSSEERAKTLLSQ